MMTRSNEEWLAHLRAADDPIQASALDDLRQRLKRNILYYLSQERSDLRSLSTHEIDRMADDFAQDATLRVLANVDKFRGESQFTTWANRIAVRLVISELRRSRYKDFSLEDLTADGELLPVRAVTSTPLGPEKSVERDDVLQRIDQALTEALTERQHQALVAVTVQGIPMDIVAEQMGTNRNALYKLLHDARRKLRAHLESQGLSMDYMLNLFQ